MAVVFVACFFFSSSSCCFGAVSFMCHISSFHWFWPLFYAHFLHTHFALFYIYLSPWFGSLFLVLHLISHVVFVMFLFSFSDQTTKTFFWWIVNIFMKSVCYKKCIWERKKNKKCLTGAMATAKTSIPNGHLRWKDEIYLPMMVARQFFFSPNKPANLI